MEFNEIILFLVLGYFAYRGLNYFFPENCKKCEKVDKEKKDE